MSIILTSEKILPREGIDKLIFNDFHKDWQGKFECIGLQIIVLSVLEQSKDLKLSAIIGLDCVQKLFSPRDTKSIKPALETKHMVEHICGTREDSPRPEGSYLSFYIGDKEMLTVPTYHIPFQQPDVFYDFRLPYVPYSLLRANTKDLLVKIVWPYGKILYYLTIGLTHHATSCSVSILLKVSKYVKKTVCQLVNLFICLTKVATIDSIFLVQSRGKANGKVQGHNNSTNMVRNITCCYDNYCDFQRP